MLPMKGVVAIPVEVSSGGIAARVLGSGRHRGHMLPMGDDALDVVEKITGWSVLRLARARAPESAARDGAVQITRAHHCGRFRLSEWLAAELLAQQGGS